MKLETKTIFELSNRKLFMIPGEGLACCVNKTDYDARLHCVLENVAINYIFADHRSAGSPMQRLTILLLNDYLCFLEIHFMADARETMRTYFVTTD